ncbi:hypothetical protein LEMLEM_LOCUS9610, partial [Lemmus lemmus]
PGGGRGGVDGAPQRRSFFLICHLSVLSEGGHVESLPSKIASLLAFEPAREAQLVR